MGFSQRLEMRQGQSLVMTPQLLQAIKLLQLSHLDLAAYVDAELERNPLLERAEDEPDGREAPDRDDFDRGDTDGADPDAFDPVAGNEASAEGPTVDQRLTDDRPDSRADLEGDLDTSFDNVFRPRSASAGRRGGRHRAADALALQRHRPRGRPDGEAPDIQATLRSETTLHEHLAAQLDLATRDPAERFIGRFLIDSIDEAGYLAESVEGVAERLGVGRALVERALAIVQTFDPSGVGARSLAECLAIQLKERDRFDPAMKALLERLDLVARRDLAALRRACGSTTRIWPRCCASCGRSTRSRAGLLEAAPSRC
jgi:RNA polymerase sigma-54 factor